MKLPVPFIQLPLSFDASALATEINGLEESLWRSHPSGLPGNTALPLVAADGNPARGDDLFGPMRATPALQRCRYMRQVLASLDAVLGRVRLMRLSAGAEVNPHVDTNHYWNERVRVHIPVVTHPSVRFFCGDAETHMAAGECWIFDTWRLHRVTNETGIARVHLVVDTVGSIAFGKLVNAGRSHDGPEGAWTPRYVAPSDTEPELIFESVNLMSPMSYWELREHVAFLLAEAQPHPLLPIVRHVANEFVLDWRTLWFRFGADAAGASDYQRTLREFLASMRRLGAELHLKNQTQFFSAVNGLLGKAIRGTETTAADEEATRAPLAKPAAAEIKTDYPFDRPVFIVSPPRSGSSLLFETLALSPSACTIGGESHGIIEGSTASGALGAAARGYTSNRLDASDATPEIITALRERFRRRAFDRDGRRPGGLIRLLEKTPKNALRIPFLAKVFPDALFVYLYREPREVLASMMEAWESGGFRTYPQLPEWTGLPWSLVLVPGWRDLIGKPLAEIVAAQWRTTTDILLRDLENLPATRWCVARYGDLIADPNAEIERLCAAIGFDWDRRIDGGLPVASHTVSTPRPDKWRARAPEVETALGLVGEVAGCAARAARR
ncbi:MAG TPA: sulfotransferase [Rhodanobacteraceae bacterium]|nr:sulfotransferase [Rhodanobacteraceae bacterium]